MHSNSVCHNIFSSKPHIAEECLPFFQPIVDVGSHLCGIEVLARWNMSDGSILSPDLFISQVVHAGLSGFMTNILLRKTVGTLLSLKPFLPSGMLVTFNVGASDNNSAEIIYVCKLIQKHLTQLCPVLVCELTEHREWGNSSEDNMFLETLERENISLALDDFGTKYSNLDVLSRVNAGFIKIGGSFINGINKNPSSRNLAECVIFAANKFSLRVIAEGVENKWQYSWLIKHGVTLFQGYYFSPPLSAEQFSVFVRDKKH
ncbi:TPA: EAL domain-containing protein [Escherichia coli]|nr:EAL domain-containing protein [Escherichia coli]HAZ3906369.1 EAL domain-containing protein [Escherichia coli]HBA7074176.1 EAL domain-containing protein [Escherichia coli]HBA7189047.1 EAL domain-containing protein [Escherichia coli]HBA8276201.1 EAL domain-containing protein [Escherichia coli]